MRSDRGDLSVKDDLVEGFGHGELLAAQIVRSVCPVADGAVVAAAAALPADRCVWLSADHDDAARAGAVGGSASARQGAFPGGAGISGGGCCDDAGQVLAEPACWARGVGGQVKEVVQIGDQHGLAL